MYQSVDEKLDLVLERRVAATPSELFWGWTTARTYGEWFCPRPWRVDHCELDVRHGGVFATTMVAPDGQVMPESKGCFLDVQAPHSLVWTNLMREGWIPNALPEEGFGMVCRLSFEVLDAQNSLYRAHVRHSTQEGKKQHEALGFTQGWSIALDQLLEVIEAAR